MNGNHNISVEHDGVLHSGVAYQTADGVLIHLPGIQLPGTPAFAALFQPIPDERLNSGFIEVGEWDGQAFPFEGELFFGLGPDGAVWAKVCDSPDELPGVDLANEAQGRAWRMLAEAEEAFSAKSMARQRAAYGNWPAPRSIPDYLMWLEDETAVQEQQAANHPEEAAERAPYAAALRGLAGELRQAGFTPTPVPWAAGEGAS